MTDLRLARRLAFVVLVKVAVIAAFWMLLVADLRVDVDAEAAAAHLVPAAGAAAFAQGARP